MTTGLTTTGFSRPLQADLADQILADERGSISDQLDGSASTVIGNLNQVFADQLAQAWEVLEEAVNGYDPENATDSRLVALCLLTGTIRRGATAGLVTTTLNLDASQTYAPGDLVAHVVNDPANRWHNRDTVTSTTAGTYSATFISEATGTGTVAAAGTLTVIASPVTGWNSITNAADATEGQDQESIEALRARREEEIALPGSGTVDAIRADVIDVTGVIECFVDENTTDVYDANGLPPHSFRAVVWDGSPAAALDNDIAQAIYGSRPAGIASVGSYSGNTTTADGRVVAVAFERAAVQQIYVSVQIASTLGVAAADVKTAILAAMPTDVGADVVYARIAGSVFNVKGVDDYVFVHIGTSPSPSGTSNISISTSQIAILQAANITVTGDVT